MIKDNKLKSKTDSVKIKRGRKKRDMKSLHKSESDQEDSLNVMIKNRNHKGSAKRDKYFCRHGSVYQAYDDFLKKRRKDKKAEFISKVNEPNEEIIGSTHSKDLLRYSGGVGNEDTFCYCNTVSYDEMIACDNPK